MMITTSISWYKGSTFFWIGQTF